MRDESVDGTLSPVSNKGTSEDETDNTTARRKVKIYFYMQIASERNRSLFGKGAINKYVVVKMKRYLGWVFL